MKTKKFLSILLALMMMLSSVPMFAFAATAPTVTSWPTIVEEYAEVGMLYSSVTLTGGEASVPGTFSPRSATGYFISPSAGTTVRLKFTPDDIENYTAVNAASSACPKIEVRPCSNPVLQGEIVAKKNLKGTAIGTSELSLADDATIMAYATEITTRVDTITFDNPDKVYTEEGTYEEPVTIKFKVHSSGMPYAVDLKATAKITVADKLDAEITTAPTAASIGIDDNTTAKDIVLSGGAANVDGRFVISNPEQKLTIGENTVNVTFIPADTSKYNPASVDIIVSGSGKIKVPENLVISAEWTGKTMSYRYLSPKASSLGIEPADAKISFSNTENTESGFLKLYFVPGEYDAYITVSATDYASTTVPVKINILPAKSTGAAVKSGTTSVVQPDGSYLLNITVAATNDAPIQNGTMVVYVNGEAIAEFPSSKTTQKVQHIITKSGNYKVTVGYIAGEGDYYIYENGEWDSLGGQDLNFEVVMPRAIGTKKCNVETAALENGKYEVGSDVRVRAEAFATDKYQITGWKFYDDAGNEFVPEGLPEAYMTLSYINFTMPNTDMTVEAIIEKLPEPEQPDDGGSGDVDIPDIELPDIDLDLDFDGTHKFDFVNLIQNLIAKLKAFIQQIGDFFSNMSLEGLGNIMG